MNNPFVALLLASICMAANVLAEPSSFEEKVQTQAEKNRAFAEKMKVQENLGVTINTSLIFQDEFKSNISIESLLDSGKPLVVQFGYFTCPMLCGLVSDGLLQVINNSEVILGKDYSVASISISDFDSTENANSYGQKYRDGLWKKHDKASWRFLVGQRMGTPENTAALLANRVGFRYQYLEEYGEYGHPAVLVVLSPEGKVTRYLYGAQFSPFNFKLAIAEAKDEKARSSVERALLFCYNYDPQKKGYALHAERVMRIGSALFLVVLLAFVWRLVKKSRKK